MASALKISGLKKTYANGVTALKGVSLDIPEGDFFALLGPNGAGKTTLLNAISAVVPTSRGTSRLTAKPTAHDPVSFARAGVGRSFQDPHLIDNATVLENVLIGAHAVHRRSIAGQVLRPLATYRHERDLAHAALDILHLVGMAHLAGELAGDLPYGPRKVVDIARALAGDPHLVLLDEPSSGLDEHERRALASLLVELRRIGRAAFLLVEHNMELVRSIADRVIGLAAGAKLIEGHPDEVLGSDVFRAAITGASTGTDAPKADQ